ncbi:MAG TPA: hypothetical protein VH062_03060 [Polyangiaceae bacterium]|jgi:hypothetical protein|nr:hypothetical protein [Polyangiaceae bacterium]
MHNTKWLALSLASIVGVACSDAAHTGDAPGDPESSPTASEPKATAVVASLPDAGVSARTLKVSEGAVAVRVPPSTECVIHPEGAPVDSTRTAKISAGADGEIRFFLGPEAQAWGTRLAVECTLDGKAQGRRLVDLDDSSTFLAKSNADLQPKVVRTRPALTGDLSTYAPNDLIPKGYSPRPDAIKNPQEYAEWVKGVSSPVDIYDAVPVTMLGAKAGTGTFEGTSGSTADQNPWTGFVQSAGGFQNFNSSNGNFPLAVFGALYQEYSVSMLAPFTFGCTNNNCSSSFMWAGIGGWPTDFFGIFSPDLLQSGFMTIPFGSGPVVKLFAEWVGQSRMDPPVTFNTGGKFASGDRFQIIGFAGDANCALKTPPSVGCFFFYDVTNAWIVAGRAPFPTSSTWWPVTTEYVYERSSAGMNENYFAETMTGEGIDTGGTAHLDPGNPAGNGDPYIVVTQFDSHGNACSTAGWANGAASTSHPPQDPMALVFNNCGPN